LKQDINKIFVFIILLVGSVLLFFGGPDYYAARSYKNIWNIGHILLFFTFTYALLNYYGKMKKQNILGQFLLLSLFVLIIGVSVELLQVKIDRDLDFHDVWRDFLGMLLFFFFFAPARFRLSKKAMRIIQAFLLVFLLIEFYFPFKAIADEIISREQFPVLSDFETPFETSRWKGDARLHKVADFSHTGKACARIFLKTDLYSGVSLNYFPRNWEGFRYLEFYVYSENNLRMTCRIHDDIHIKNKEPFEDRLNKRLFLQHGWNHIIISIQEIENAPAGRKMNLRKIMNFGIFATQLPSPAEISIDDVSLVR
jgi:hypothetical protein